MQLQKLDLPDGWEENEYYTRNCTGVVASYYREGTEYCIDVIELAPSSEYNFEVQLRISGEGGDTWKEDSIKVNSYEGCEEGVKFYAERYTQCK